MRLIICFQVGDLKNISLTNNDIVLLDGLYPIEDGILIDINTLKMNFEDLEASYQNLLNLAEESKYLNQYYLDLLRSSSNNFYFHNYRYLNLWIENLKLLLASYEFDEILLSSLINKASYLPYYEAEGEVTKKVFYKRFDFISPYIYAYLNEAGLTNRISVLNKRSVFLRKIRIFLRRDCLLLFKFILHCIRWFKLSKRNISVDFKVKNIILSRGIAHSNYFYPLLKNINFKPLVLVSDGLYSQNKNYFSLLKRGVNAINLYEVLSLWDIFLAYFHILKRLFELRFLKFRYSISIKTENFPLGLPMFDVLTEMIIFQLEISIYCKGLANLIRKMECRNLNILNGEMISQYPLWVDKLCLKMDCCHYQVQTASMDVVKSPNFIFSKKFFINSQSDLNKFKTIGNRITRDNFSFIGNLSLNNLNVINSTTLDKVVYFSQPYEVSYQDLILKKLVILSNELRFKLYIKLHPRENINDYISEYSLDSNYIQFLHGDLNVHEISEQYDAAVTRTSSVIQDLMLIGMPVLACPISPYDMQLNFEFLKPENLNVMSSILELTKTFTEYKIFIEEYHSFRISYINNSGIGLGIDSFIKYFDEK